MGRRQAVRELDPESEIRRLDEKGIIYAVRGVSDLEEAAGAFCCCEGMTVEIVDRVSIS